MEWPAFQAFFSPFDMIMLSKPAGGPSEQGFQQILIHIPPTVRGRRRHYGLSWARQFRATVEHVVNEIDQVCYVEVTLSVNISRIHHERFRPVIEHIVNQVD